MGGQLLFTCTGEARVVTDPAGAVILVVGVLPTPVHVSLALPGGAPPVELTIHPNEEWAVGSGGAATLARRVPFTAPFK